MTLQEHYTKENELSKKVNEFQFDYSDSFTFYSEVQDTQLTILDFAEAFLQPGPKWLQSLLKLRDKLVSPFNLKTGADKIEGDLEFSKKKWEIGSQPGLFKIIDILDDEIVFGEEDKHLDFRVVMKMHKTEREVKCKVSTLVKYNNSLGKVYFFFVKPFHKIIVPYFINRNFRKLVV